MQIFVLTVLLLLIIISVSALQWQIRKLRIKRSNRKKDLLSTLKELDTEIKSISKDEFFDKNDASAIDNAIDKLINESIDGELEIKEIEKEIQKIKESTILFRQEMTNKKNTKKELSEKVRAEVKSFKDYLDSHSFYPKEMVFAANKLQGKALDLETLNIDRITFSFEDLEKELSSFQKELKTFFRLHSQLLKIIEKGNSLTGNQKQEIFFLLQNGEFEKTENLIQQYLKSNEQVSKELNL